MKNKESTVHQSLRLPVSFQSRALKLVKHRTQKLIRTDKAKILVEAIARGLVLMEREDCFKA